MRWVALPFLVALATLACTPRPEPRTSSPAAGGSSGSYCAGVKRLAAAGAIEETDCGIARGPKTEKKIALVFTAGSFCEGGPTVLDTLERHRAKASFFLLTEALRPEVPGSTCEAVVPRLVREGHYVGPHSDTHPTMVETQGGPTIIRRGPFDREITQNLEALRAAGVAGPVRYWMPPSETFNDELATWSAEHGLVTVHLAACPETRGDYLPVTTRGGKFSNEAILRRIEDCEARDPSHLNGAILFFHLGVGPNREEKDKLHQVFPTLMKSLAEGGYSFVRIDDLLEPSVGKVLDASLAAPPDRSEPDYPRMTPEVALRTKYHRMLPFTRNRVEREILDVAYQALRDGRRKGLWLDVNLEDLMAHARQESGAVIDALDQGGDVARFHAVGDDVWSFHQLPSNDLLGFISFSVWQTITPNYLWLGKDISGKVDDLWARYVDPYRLTDAEVAAARAADCGPADVPRAMRDAWGFPRKMEERESRAKAKPMFDAMVDDLTGVLVREPTLHAKVIAALVASNYRRDGVRSPKAIRSYFWSAIQEHLDPQLWLRTVRYDDDVPPTPSNGCVDTNVAKRGDYGKQVVLGNTYNDRGMVFWYGVTRDRAALAQLVSAWSHDPAHLTAADYERLREAGHLAWSQTNPALFDWIVAQLPRR